MRSSNLHSFRNVMLTLLTLASGALAACGGGGGSGSPTRQATGTVSIAPGDNTVVAGGSSMKFTATVSSDPAKAGVNWTLSCSTAPCGTISPATTASSVPTSYSAPQTPIGDDRNVTLTATAVSNTAISTSETLIVPGRHVVLVVPQTLGAGASAQFTASVQADPANTGVGWTLQCAAADCGTLSDATSASGTPVTYSAPPSPVLTDLVVNVTATSVSAPVVQASGSVTIAAVTVAVGPVSALLPLNATQQLAGTLAWAAVDGITWTLTQNGTACTGVCGTISPAQSASGVAVTYSAPAVMPAAPTTMVTATSVADPTKSASTTIKLTTGSVKLVPMSMNFRGAHGQSCAGPHGDAVLTNTGTSVLAISGMTIAGPNPTVFTQTNSCGSSLAAGSSCTITIKGTCTKVAIGATAVLSISDSSTDSPQLLSLTATTSARATAAIRSALAEQASAAVPAPRGSRTVGTRVLRLSDTKRADPYLADGTARELMLRFWYPAVRDAACTRADYTSPQVWSHFSTLLGVALPRVATNSCLDSRVASGLHPVVVLTHGFTGTFTDYTFLAEDLASRGYVVVAVDHTHEATAVEFPDGRLERSVFGSHLTEYTRRDADALRLAVTVRLDDLRFVLDELARLNAAPSGDLAGRLDLSRIALVGHSLGGFTALRALEIEPRFKAGVLLDAVIPPHFAKPIEQPVLSLIAGRERWDETDCRLWNALHGSRLAVNLPGTEHIALSDAIWLLKGVVKAGDPASDNAISAIRQYVASFLDANLVNGAPRAPLTGAVPAYPGAVIATQTQSLCRTQ